MKQFQIYAIMAMKDAIFEPCDDGYCATHPKLRGIVAYGANIEACVEDFVGAVEEWAKITVDSGQDLPELRFL